jgi:hypothetical protein
MTDQSETYVVIAGPFAMARDCGNHGNGEIFPGEHLQDLSFREKGIVEDYVDQLFVSFGEKRAGNAGWSAPGQCEFLAERKLRKTCAQLILRVALQFRGGTRQKSKLYKVHQVKLTEEAQAGEARAVRMKRESALDPIIFDQRLAARNLFENFGREILAIEKQAELRLIERGIIEECEEHVRGGMMQEHGEFITAGGASALAVVVRAGHASSQRTPQRR